MEHSTAVVQHVKFLQTINTITACSVWSYMFYLDQESIIFQKSGSHLQIL